MSGCEVLAWEMLVRRCGSRGRAAGRVRDGAWQRVLRDAYVDGAQDAGSPEVRAAALQLLLPRGVALSHTAALWVLDLDVLQREVLDITGERGRHLAARLGVRVHIAALPDEQLVQVGGLYAVSAARAVVDLARSCPLPDAVGFADLALRQGVTTTGPAGRCRRCGRAARCRRGAKGVGAHRRA